MCDFDSADAFLDELLNRYFTDLRTEVDGNFDHDRFSSDGIDRSAQPYDFLHKQALMALVREKDAFFNAYNLLSDAQSRSWFIDLLRYRLAGHSHVKLPSNNEAYWELRNAAHAYSYERPKTDIRLPGNVTLGHYQYRFEGVDLKMDAFTLLWPFMLRQYFYSRDGIIIKPEKGDVVIDAGAGIGDTSLAFGTRAGPSGKVYAFEFMPKAADVCAHNFSMNSGVCDFRLHREALADKVCACGADQTLRGGGFDLGHKWEEGSYPSTTLDHLVDTGVVERVDFIKMDIEGAELKALQGARNTLCRFRPKLALSLYHNVRDFYEIPQYLEGLGLGYRMYIDHYTIYASETVLYADAR